MITQSILKIDHPKISNLTLRLLKREDAKQLFSVIDRNRDHLSQHLIWVDSCKSWQDELKFIEKFIEQYQNKYALALVLCESTSIIGMVSFIKFDWDKQTTELGYWIDQAQQGKGIILHACKTMIEYGFNKLGLKSIIIKCAVANTRSNKIPQALGFNLINTVIEDGRETSIWLYEGNRM